MRLENPVRFDLDWKEITREFAVEERHDLPFCLHNLATGLNYIEERRQLLLRLLRDGDAGREQWGW